MPIKRPLTVTVSIIYWVQKSYWLQRWDWVTPLLLWVMLKSKSGRTNENETTRTKTKWRRLFAHLRTMT